VDEGPLPRTRFLCHLHEHALVTVEVASILAQEAGQGLQARVGGPHPAPGPVPDEEEATDPLGSKESREVRGGQSGRAEAGPPR
jgi:hypothetical protein